MGFCSCTIKFTLVVFNMLCALVGLTVLGISVWVYLRSSNFSNLLHGEVSGTIISMMVLGSVTVLIAFLGCCGIVKEDPCFITTYAVMLSVILVGQLVVAGIGVYFFKGQNVEQELKKNLDAAFKNYDKNKGFIDLVQQEYQCCGFEGPSSYRVPLPPSCCPNPEIAVSGGPRCPADEAFPNGCQGPTVLEIKRALKAVFVTLFVVVGIELLCIICTFSIARSIREERRWSYSN